MTFIWLLDHSYVIEILSIQKGAPLVHIFYFFPVFGLNNIYVIVQFPSIFGYFQLSLLDHNRGALVINVLPKYRDKKQIQAALDPHRKKKHFWLQYCCTYIYGI